MSGVGFVHLRVRSAFSLLEGALHLKDIVKLAAADAQPAIAVTDRANLFGALEFSDKAAGAGLQPIVGCDLPLDLGEPDDGRSRPAEAMPSVLLLAADRTGWANLVRIVSRAYLAGGGEGRVAADRALVEANAAGLVALTGWRAGPLGEALARDRADLARHRLGWLQAVFGDRLYVEIQRHGLADEPMLEAAHVDLAYAAGLPLVATNDVHFAVAGDHQAHEALLAIADGTRLSDDKRRRLTPEHRLKTRSEMIALFSDLSEATANAVEIARRCNARPLKAPPLLPRFASAEDGADIDGDAVEAEILRERARAGLRRRLEVKGPHRGSTPRSTAIGSSTSCASSSA